MIVAWDDKTWRSLAHGEMFGNFRDLWNDLCCRSTSLGQLDHVHERSSTYQFQ